MGDLKVLWREVLAPQLKAAKSGLGRRVPERQIAYEVAQATGQESSRSLVAMWLSGEREPTVTQFIALCRRLMLDPVQILASSTYYPAVASAQPLVRKFVKSRNNDSVPQSKTKAKARTKAHKVSQRK
jgi:hypothetical protein